mmetsp:Transcript_20827/g.34348  ORF Transcript_20827/g.34348 Transcript_20827/m.34348 type:complete len:227 (+) Transcript_20827:110-790(+)
MSDVPKYVYCFPFFFALTALILNFVGTTCKFLSISTTDATTPFSLSFGLWYHQTVNVTSNGIIADSTCTLYPPDQQVDSAWIAARVFNLIAIILGAAVLVVDGCSGCISTNPKKKLQGGALGYLIAAFSSGMSLILLNTNICSSNKNSTLGALTDMDFSSCVVSTGGKSAIASCVLWVAAAAGSALLHPSSRFWKARDDNGLDEPLVKDEKEAFIYDTETDTETAV